MEKKELPKIIVKEVCVDCNIGIVFKKNGLTILNGKLLKYQKLNGDYIFVYKCDDCFKKNKELRNYQETEVYSRVVGYLRPIQQWNKGKQLEYKQKKNYVIKNKKVVAK